MALIVDTGPIFSSLDRRDVDHQRCVSLLQTTGERIVVPSPVIVELDYLVSTRGSPAGFFSFLEDLSRGAYTVENLLTEDYARVRELCEKYADSNIGFVDAAVVAIAERLNEPKIATLDRRHFGIIRPRHVEAFELLPA